MRLFLGIDLDACDELKDYNLKDLVQLEKAINYIRLKIIQKHLDNGVIFRNLTNIYIYDSVKIGKGTVIYGDQHIRGNTGIHADGNERRASFLLLQYHGYCLANTKGQFRCQVLAHNAADTIRSK